MTAVLTLRLPTPTNASVDSQCLTIRRYTDNTVVYGPVDIPVAETLHVVCLEPGILYQSEVQGKVGGTATGTACTDFINSSDPRWCEPTLLEVVGDEACETEQVDKVGAVTLEGAVTCCGEYLRETLASGTVRYYRIDSFNWQFNADTSICGVAKCGEDILIPAGQFTQATFEDCICTSVSIENAVVTVDFTEVLAKLCQIDDSINDLVNCTDPSAISATDDSTTTPVDTPVSLTPFANDTNAASFVSINGAAQAVGVSFAVPNGTAVLNADNTVTFTPNAGFTGTSTFPYVIDDGMGNTASANMTVTIGAATSLTATNDDRSGSPIAQGGSDSFNVTTNDNNPEGTAISVNSIDGQAVVAGGSVTTANGVYALAADGQTVTFTPNAGVSGTITVPYTITDVEGDSATANITHVVSAAATSLSATDDDRTANEILQGGSDSFNITTNDNNPEGTTIVVNSVDGQAIAAGGSVTTANGTFMLAGDGQTLTFSPANGVSGTIMVPYTITDGESDSANATITYLVSPCTALCDSSDNQLCDSSGNILCFCP